MLFLFSEHFFEFIGADWIVDADGAVWLIECNCPPCTETATGLKEAEALHSNIALDIATLVVDAAVRKRPVRSGLPQQAVDSASPSDVELESVVREDNGTGFVCCRDKRDGFKPSPAVKLALNSFAWSKFVRNQKAKFVMLSLLPLPLFWLVLLLHGNDIVGLSCAHC